jgi:hypothetical protein
MMSDRFRKNLLTGRGKVFREALAGCDSRELFSRAVLIGLGIFAVVAVTSTGSRTQGPEPLTKIERETAREIARTTNISVEDAEAAVLAHRPNAADRRRWAADRRQSEAEQEALQRAFPN